MKFKKNGGFTLVELIVVIAILAILAGVAVPAYSGYIAKAEMASDLQLVGAANQAFAAAAMENDLDLEDLQGQKITLNNAGYITGMPGTVSLSSVPSIDTTNNRMLASFLRYYGDNIKTPFKYYHTQLVYGPDGFEGPAPGESATGFFGAMFEKIKNNVGDAITNFNNSAFGAIGVQGVTEKLDNVTNLAESIMTSGGTIGTTLFGALAEDMPTILGMIGMTEAEYTAMMNEMTPEQQVAYQNNLLSNYAVLQVAQSTTGTGAKTAAEQLAALNTQLDPSAINKMMKNQETSKEGVAQAALVYAMYTSYANTLTGDEKAAAEANLADMSTFAANISDITAEGSGFRTYLGDTSENSQAQKDMTGFLGAMEIINQSSQSGDTNAMKQMLEDGYGDPALIAALEELLGK